MPETFVDYKRQRFRWTYGAMQILRRHAGPLFIGSNTKLTAGQRYHFIAGWLPWLADGLNLLINIAALGWSVAMIVAPHRMDPPLMMFSFLPLVLFTFRLLKLGHLYISRVGANLRQTSAAALAGLALAHTVGVAVVKGMVTRNEPFFRTPKGSQPHILMRSLAGAAQETIFMSVLLAAAYFLTHQATFSGVLIGVPEELRGRDVTLWVAVLIIQAFRTAPR